MRRYTYTDGKVAVTQLQELDQHTVCPVVGVWIPVCPVAENRTWLWLQPVSGPDSHIQTHFSTLVPSPVT